MRIPGAAATSSVEDLDEADSPLHQPASGEAQLSETFGSVVVHAIQGVDMGRLAVDVESFRYCGLHLEGQLVGFDSSAKALVIRVIDACQRIQFSKETQISLLLFQSNRTARRCNIRERLVWIDIQPDAGILWTKI